MTDDKARNTPQKTASARRAQRLRSALRENLKRRKAQARGRALEGGNTEEKPGKADPAISPELLPTGSPAGN